MRVFLLFLFLFCSAVLVSAQSYNIPSDSCATITVTPGTAITVCDPGGNNGNYPNSCNGSLTIVSDAATVISLQGNYSTENGYDILYVYDGLSSRDHLIGTYSGTGYANITAQSGAITLIFFSNNTVTQMGFTFSCSVCDTAALQARNVILDQPTVGCARLRWDDIAGSTSWTVRYGTAPNALNGQLHTNTDTALLTGLTPNTRYYYRIYSNGASTTLGDQCNVTMRQFRTPCSDTMGSCINYGDLQSCYCEARYGTYANPNLYTGITCDSAPENRHISVIYNNETDPRTGGILNTIPNGYSHSIKLGNQYTGGQAENVTYRYHVDTTEHDLLLLKYAAVLEDPSHLSSEQPRFAFQILDCDDNPLNPGCYSAEFAASDELGWNTYTYTGYNNMPTNIRWKDWTTVGIDLSPLHGQDIYIRLSTYDCARQEHFGYAYFVLDCGEKKIEYTNCGATVENTFSAPDGFAYRWYSANSPDVTIDTTQSLHVTQAGEYICTLTYGTNPGSTCSFTLSATAIQRLPAALFSWEETGYDSCNVVIQFHNGSVICNDSEHQQLTNIPCDSIIWLFDNGTVSSEDEPTLSFSRGSHSVRLVAMIGNGSCSDTATQYLEIQSPCQYSDTVEATICSGNSYLFFDTLIATTGIYERDSGYLHRRLCLTVRPTDTISLHDTIVENNLPYPFADTLIDITENRPLGQSVQFSVSASHSNMYGCDSTTWLFLHVWLNRSTVVDSSTCLDSLPYIWYDTIVNNLATSSGADSSVTLVVTYNPIFNIFDTTSACSGQSDLFGHSTSGDYTYLLTTTQGCDSTIHVNVSILPVDHITLHDTIVENDLPYPFADSLIDISENRPLGQSVQFSVTASHSNMYGCDSTTVLNLHVWLNRHTSLDSTFCYDSLPYVWNDTHVTSLLTTHGADSTVTLLLTVMPAYSVADTVAICDGDVATYGFTTEGIYEVPLTTTQGCDSIVSLSVIVYPVYDLHYYDTICDNRFPYLFADSVIVSTSESDITLQLTELTSHRCDSISTLHLTVNPTHRIYEHAVVCDGMPFTWKDGITYYYSTYEPSIMYSDINGCDSTLFLILDLNDSFSAAMRINPTVATYDNSLIQMTDISESNTRTWFYMERTDTGRVVTFQFPLNEDSVEVLMVARSSSGCIDSVVGTVIVDRAIIWPPNAFTPDEPTNNRFYIASSDILTGEIFIYNRQGTLVSHINASEESWDGSCRGVPCPQATYTWIMKYTTKSQPRIERQAKGTVTLIR